LAAKNNQTTVISAIGDIKIGGKVGEKIRHEGGGYLFENIPPILSKKDITIGNLECHLSDRGIKFVDKDY
jgi:hypothetical protein